MQNFHLFAMLTACFGVLWLLWLYPKKSTLKLPQWYFGVLFGLPSLCVALIALNAASVLSLRPDASLNSIQAASGFRITLEAIEGKALTIGGGDNDIVSLDDIPPQFLSLKFETDSPALEIDYRDRVASDLVVSVGGRILFEDQSIAMVENCTLSIVSVGMFSSALSCDRSRSKDKNSPYIGNNLERPKASTLTRFFDWAQQETSSFREAIQGARIPKDVFRYSDFMPRVAKAGEPLTITYYSRGKWVSWRSPGSRKTISGLISLPEEEANSSCGQKYSFRIHRITDRKQGFPSRLSTLGNYQVSACRDEKGSGYFSAFVKPESKEVSAQEVHSMHTRGEEEVQFRSDDDISPSGINFQTLSSKFQGNLEEKLRFPIPDTASGQPSPAYWQNTKELTPLTTTGTLRANEPNTKSQVVFSYSDTRNNWPGLNVSIVVALVQCLLCVFVLGPTASLKLRDFRQDAKQHLELCAVVYFCFASSIGVLIGLQAYFSEAVHLDAFEQANCVALFVPALIAALLRAWRACTVSFLVSCVIIGLFWLAGWVELGSAIKVASVFALVGFALTAVWLVGHFKLFTSAKDEDKNRQIFRISFGVFLACVLLRLVLGAVGFREAVPFLGERLSHTLWHLPLNIIAWSGVLSLWTSRWTSEPNKSAFLLTLLGAGLCSSFIPVLMNDSGALLYFFPVMLVAGALAADQFNPSEEAMRLSIWWQRLFLGFGILLAPVFVLLGVGSVLLLVLFFSFSACILIITPWRNIDVEPNKVLSAIWYKTKIGLQGFCSAALPKGIPILIFALFTSMSCLSATNYFFPKFFAKNSSLIHEQNFDVLSTNDVRLLSILAPQRVGDSGVTTAQEQQAAFAELRHYASIKRGVDGYGFLSPVKPGYAIARYQLNDNVSSVHFIAPFGMIGTFGYLLFLFSLVHAAMIGARRMQTSADDLNSQADIAKYVPSIALATLGGVSLYMFLANLGVVPFTGRNVYLFAVSSLGDLWEAAILLILIFLAMSQSERTSVA